jgi:hypothetical protein
MRNLLEAASGFDGRKASSRQPGWETGLPWILMNSACGALGILLMRGSSLALRDDMASPALAVISSCVLSPFLTGFLQWLVLRRLLARSIWWILASGLGYAAGLLVFAAVVSAGIGVVGGEESQWVILPFIVGSLLFGAMAGIAQSVVLRRSLAHSLLWVLTSAVGFSPAVVLYIIATRGNDVSVPVAVATGAVSGVVYGIVTAIALRSLFRQPVVQI